jgi:predicted HTH domain antitoxin
MTIELPDVKIGSEPLTPEQARIEIACGLYAGRQVSMGRAAKIAGVPYVTFMHELGKRGICLNYTMVDLEHDFEMAEKLARKAAAA